MSDITRRELLGGVVGAAALMVVGAGGKYAYGASETSLLRPPGGQDEAHFIATCIRCDRCVTVCPTEVIAIANLDDGFVNARTPYMNFRQGSCTFCDGEYRCIANCPTLALKPFDYETDKIGLAVVDSDLCISFAAVGGCRICVDECPYEALSLDENSRPVVDASLCNGCGICETKCPSSVYRKYSKSGKRGINIEIDSEVRL